MQVGRDFCAQFQLQMSTNSNVCATSCSFRTGKADMQAWTRCGAPVKTRDRLFIASEVSSAATSFILFIWPGRAGQLGQQLPVFNLSWQPRLKSSCFCVASLCCVSISLSKKKKNKTKRSTGSIWHQTLLIPYQCNKNVSHIEVRLIHIRFFFPLSFIFCFVARTSSKDGASERVETGKVKSRGKIEVWGKKKKKKEPGPSRDHTAITAVTDHHREVSRPSVSQPACRTAPHHSSKWPISH